MNRWACWHLLYILLQLTHQILKTNTNKKRYEDGASLWPTTWQLPSHSPGWQGRFRRSLPRRTYLSQHSGRCQSVAYPIGKRRYGRFSQWGPHDRSLNTSSHYPSHRLWPGRRDPLSRHGLRSQWYPTPAPFERHKTTTYYYRTVCQAACRGITTCPWWKADPSRHQTREYVIGTKEWGLARRFWHRNHCSPDGNPKHADDRGNRSIHGSWIVQRQVLPQQWSIFFRGSSLPVALWGNTL